MIICEFDAKLPADIGISDNDLSAVVGNVLDNAIEACRYCSDRKYIQFALIHFNHSLILTSENSTDGKANSIRTRKKDELNHGIGMNSIQQIAKKYHGDCQHWFDDHSFRLELTLFEVYDEKPPI